MPCPCELASPRGSSAFQSHLALLHHGFDKHALIDLALPLEEWKVLLTDENLAETSIHTRAKMLFVAAHGFEVLSPGEAIPLTSRPNHPSVRSGTSNIDVGIIDAEIQKLITKGWVVPWATVALENPGTPHPKISPLGAVAKKDSLEPRIIFDLSSPKGSAVNDFSVPPPFHYPSIDTASEFILPGSWMAKLDLKSGFHSVPLHPSSYRWLGFRWDRTEYVYKVLPFGLATSPWIFCEFTSFICATLRHRLLLLWTKESRTSRVPFAVVYVDDFLIMYRPQSTSSNS